MACFPFPEPVDAPGLPITMLTLGVAIAAIDELCASSRQA